MVTSRTSFNAAALTKLLKKPNACVFLRKCKRHIALSPKALNNINDAVLGYLNRLVTHFDSELDAVVLGCRNVNVLTNLGTIMDDSPHVHIDIEAEFYLFKPKKGSILSGVVNKKSRDNIGCLVHDIFNASIPIEPDDGIDIDNISLGEVLTFCVEVVDFSQSLPYIKGKLIDSQYESSAKQASNSEGKKRKKSDQPQARKKIKSEVDSFCEDDNITFTPSIKFPTSILKKTSSIGIESSPARRISFYGDNPDVNKEPVDIDATKGKSKKKKKESEHSFVEESSTQQKKKKTVSSFGNEPETDVFIQDSEQISKPSMGKQKVKKKKSQQMEQVGEIGESAEENLGDSRDHNSNKKKKQALIKSKSFNLVSKSEEMSESSAVLSKTKKKKKKKNENEISEDLSESLNVRSNNEKKTNLVDRENETLRTEENYEGQELIHKASTQKKLKKKSQKIPLYEQDSAIYDAGEEEDHREKALVENVIKKEREDITNKSLKDKQKTNKSKTGKVEANIQKNDSSTKKQETVFTNEIEKKKKKLGKRKEHSLSLEPDFSGEKHSHVNILPAIQLKPADKKKKSKKMNQEDVEVSDSRLHDHFSFGKKDKASTISTKLQGIANSTVIANSENRYSSDSVNSFESLSPIKKSDNDEETSGFVTSTQIEGPKTKKNLSSTKKLSARPNKVPIKKSFSVFDRDSDTSFDVQDFTFRGASPSNKIPQKQSVKQKSGSKDLITSKTHSLHHNRDRKPQSLKKSVETITPIEAPIKSSALSDTDENTSSMDVPPTPFVTKPKISELKTVQRKGKKDLLKPAGSESSSSDSETGLRNIQENYLKPARSDFSSSDSEFEQVKNQKSHLKPTGSDSHDSDTETHSYRQHSTLQQARNQSSKAFSPKSMPSKKVQPVEDSSDEDTQHNKQTKLPLANTKTSESDADSTGSDLPSFRPKPSNNADSGSDSHGSDTEMHSYRQHSTLQQARNQSTTAFSPKSMPSKGVHPDEDSSDEDTQHNKQTKLPHANTKTSESDMDSADSDMPSFRSKPSKLSSTNIKSGIQSTNEALPITSQKSSVNNSKVHGKGTRKVPKAIAEQPLNIGGMPLSRSQKPNTKSSAKTKSRVDSHKFPVKDDNGSYSDLPLLGIKTTQRKQSPASHKSGSGSSSGSDLDLPSLLETKITPEKKKPTSVSHKSSSSVVSESPGRQLPSEAESKKSKNKKVMPKRTKDQPKSDKKQLSESESNSIVKGILEKLQSGVIDPLEGLDPLPSLRKYEKNIKKISKAKDAASSDVQKSENKGEKMTIDNSKDSKKSTVQSRKKHKLNETPLKLTSYAAELLKNL